jgi:hypothetical protein
LLPSQVAILPSQIKEYTMLDPNIVNQEKEKEKQNLTTLDLTDSQVAAIDIEICPVFGPNIVVYPNC